MPDLTGDVRGNDRGGGAEDVLVAILAPKIMDAASVKGIAIPYAEACRRARRIVEADEEFLGIAGGEEYNATQQQNY